MAVAPPPVPPPLSPLLFSPSSLSAAIVADGTAHVPYHKTTLPARDARFRECKDTSLGFAPPPEPCSSVKH
uniref:Putative secreted peptide n=1 Tax=Anopheles braziliensis TaxID=58242 RepID=A0A2M3ZRY3_9DIPT